MKGDGYYLLAENSPEKLIKSVNQFLFMGYELHGSPFAVYYPPDSQIWHYQAVIRGKPDEMPGEDKP